MYAEKFGKEYARSHESDILDPDPDRREVLNEARIWATRYSDLLLEYLHGSTIEPGEAQELNRRYLNWHIDRVPHILKTIEKSPFDDDFYSSAFNEMGFHLMNAPMMPLWIPLLTGQRQPLRGDVQRAQAGLSLMGIGYAQERAEALRDLSLFDKSDPKRHSMHKAFTGISTEFDTAITLLELSKNSPITVLPAPGVFEHGTTAPINADFIVVDMQQREARGVQVKSHLDEVDIERYDPRLITLVDGDTDLNNTQSVRYRAGSTRQKHISWPGYISLHHLLAQKKLTRLVRGQPRSAQLPGATLALTRLMRARHAARELVGTTRSSNERAAKVVGERVLRDLYINE